MTRDHDNNPENESEELTEFARDPFGRGLEEEQQELEGLKQTYEEDYDSGYDGDGDYDDDPYDEPERDTPYSPAFQEDESVDEPDQNLEQGEKYFEEPSEQPLFREVRPEDEEPDEGEDPLLYSGENGALEDGDAEEDKFVEDDAATGGDQWNVPRLSAAEPESWQDEQDYDDTQDGDNEYTQRLPMGLLMVAGLAIILLIAGGYGVMQQRAASGEEIRQLRAALATAASNEDVEKVLVEADALRNENSDLMNRVYDLQIDNRKLTDMVAGLEAQVEAVNEAKQASSKPVAAKPKKQPAPKPAPGPSKPAPAVAQAPVSPGTWFVNFGSYGQQSVAESWRGKLDPDSGNVITAASERDGRTFYRVRIVNLPDKDTANAVARALEKQYGLSRLWVGQQ